MPYVWCCPIFFSEVMCMSTEFKSLKDLEKYIRGKVETALEENVSKKVIDKLEENAQSLVYDVYTPTEYDRRYSFLRDELYQTKKKKWRVEIKPVVEFNQTYATSNKGNDLAGLVNYGDGWNGHIYEYKYPHGAPPYNRPRPFLDMTHEELSNGYYAELLKDALQSNGLNVQ